MVISFPEGSEEKMRHRYAFFNCLATDPAVGNPIRRRRIEFNPSFKRARCARRLIQGRYAQNNVA